jgi:hypothetical protein
LAKLEHLVAIALKGKYSGMCSIPKDMLDSEKMKESNNVITSENSLPSIAYQPSIQNNIVSQDSGFSTLSTVSVAIALKGKYSDVLFHFHKYL